MSSQDEQPFWVRVKDKETGHHYSVHVVDPKVHDVLKQPGADALGRPYPAKPNIGNRPPAAKEKE